MARKREQESNRAMDLALGILLVALGAWSVGGAALNLPIFMEHRKARAMVNWIGPIGARVFFVALGLAIVGLGSICIVNS